MVVPNVQCRPFPFKQSRRSHLLEGLLIGREMCGYLRVSTLTKERPMFHKFFRLIKIAIGNYAAGFVLGVVNKTPQSYTVGDVIPKESQFLGFDSVTPILPDSSAVITAQPWRPFRPDTLVIPRDIARPFLINDIKIGKNSQFVGAGSIPAEAFSGEERIKLKFDTAQIAQDISITVTNTSLKGIRFVASMSGVALE